MSKDVGQPREFHVGEDLKRESKDLQKDKDRGWEYVVLISNGDIYE